MKFSIVTPAWNVGPWLSETIESVLSQKGDFDIEYIIVSDPSSDDTVEIVRKYQMQVQSGKYFHTCNNLEMKHIELSRGDGMAVAINAGFAIATGDVFAWIPGDDVYQRDAFTAIENILNTFPEIEWVKGFDDIIDEHSNLISKGKSLLYYQQWLQAGVYGIEAYHVSQETSFWRAELWRTHGPFPKNKKSMCDYWLWLQFSKTTRLWSADVAISSFRKRPEQYSRKNIIKCKESMWDSRTNRRPLSGWIARLYFFPYYHLVPKSLQFVVEGLYPFIFPYHPRTYIAIQDGKVIKKNSKSFICRNN